MSVGSVIQVELLAVLAGVWLAHQIGAHSTQAVALICNHSKEPSAMGLLAEDMIQAASSLHPTKFLHAPRSCNGVGHRLVKFVISIGNEVVWFEEFMILFKSS